MSYVAPIYESFCERCHAVTEHVGGACTVCVKERVQALASQRVRRLLDQAFSTPVPK